MQRRQVRSIRAGAVRMALLMAALYWLPVVNGILAGAIGGYRAGTVSHGALAAGLAAPATLLSLWILLVVVAAPAVPLVASLGPVAEVALSVIALFLGAAAGGAYADAREDRRVLA